MNRELIDQYEHGADKLKLAVRGLTPEDLLVAPIPGKWSTQQVVIHLADAECAIADRMRRLIAEDNPTLMAWNENKFAANLFYNDQSSADAILMIEVIRRQMVRVFRKLPENTWSRAGQHSERGRVTLEENLAGAVKHFEHHLKFIHEKRAAMGKEMW